MKAKFKCLSCGYEYEAEPWPTTCLRCGCIWIKWINYEEMERLIFKDERIKNLNKEVGKKTI